MGEGVRGLEAAGWDPAVPAGARALETGDAVGLVVSGAREEDPIPTANAPAVGSRPRFEASRSRTTRARGLDGGGTSGSRMPLARVSRRRIAPARSISSTGKSSSSGDHCDGGEG